MPNSNQLNQSLLKGALQKSVAIIGAGLSGAVCAKSLNGLVNKVQVFEQNAYIGGRLAIDSETSTTSFFSVTTVFFQQIVSQWQSAGWVHPRSGWDVDIDQLEIVTQEQSQSEYEAEGSMIELANTLLEGIPVRLNSALGEVESVDGRWRLFDELGDYLGQFDCVIFTFPAADILPHQSELYSLVEQVENIPCWSVVYTFEEELQIPYSSANINQSGIAFFYKRLSSVGQQYVVQATPEWSEKYSALPIEDIKQWLLEEFFNQVGLEHTAVSKSVAHFWTNKSVMSALGEDCFFDFESGLGLCGDFCLSPRVEGAVLSGFSVADRVMKFLSK